MELTRRSTKKKAPYITSSSGQTYVDGHKVTYSAELSRRYLVSDGVAGESGLNPRVGAIVVLLLGLTLLFVFAMAFH